MTRIISILILAFSLLSCSKFEETERFLELNNKFDQGDYEFVDIEGERFVKQYPKSAEGWSLLGWANIKTDDIERAEQCFNRALKIDPTLDNAHVGLGATFRYRGDRLKAREHYGKAIAILPSNAEAYASLLVIELMDKNYSEAVRLGEKAWQLRKDSAIIAANLSVAYHFVEQYEKRDEMHQHAVRLGYLQGDKLKAIYRGELVL